MTFNITPKQDSTTLLTKSKLEVFNVFMANGWTKIDVDPTHPDTELPLKLKNEESVILLFGYNLPKPILDLNTNQIGVSATLSFGQIPFKVFVPWDAIRAITDDKGTGVYYTSKQTLAVEQTQVQRPTVIENQTDGLSAEELRAMGRPALSIIKGGKN